MGLSAVCMDCHPSQKAIENTKISVDTVESAAQPLLETHWTVIEINGQPLTDTSAHKEMYLVLSKVGNKAEGNGSCNAFSSTYTLKNNELIFGPVVSTKMYCQGIESENKFFKALSATSHFELKGNTLTFLEGNKLPVVKFVAH